MPDSTFAEVVIVGAGFAGAATAWHLTRRGLHNVLLLEREELPGMHASGQNAGIARQLCADPVTFRLNHAGTAFLHHAHNELESPTPLLQPVGSLLLGELELLQQWRAVGRGAIPSDLVADLEMSGRVPVLEGTQCRTGLFTPSDGVVDIHGFLQGYLRGAQRLGARLKTRCEVLSVQKKGTRFQLDTTQGALACETLVNACGAWAGIFGGLCGATKLQLTPMRRHLHQSAPASSVNPSWPFVWDISHELYFRPESGGLLLSACDETAVEPGWPVVDGQARANLAEKIMGAVPALQEVQLLRSWAGLRTFSTDRRFVIGWDKKTAGIFWVAALAGHGVTASYAVGELAAQCILQKRNLDPALDPGRFATG